MSILQQLLNEVFYYEALLQQQQQNFLLLHEMSSGFSFAKHKAENNTHQTLYPVLVVS